MVLDYMFSFVSHSRKPVFIAGETDFLKPYGLELLESCVDPVVIHHPKGHTIPRFGEFSLYIIIYASCSFWLTVIPSIFNVSVIVKFI